MGSCIVALTLIPVWLQCKGSRLDALSIFCIIIISSNLLHVLIDHLRCIGTSLTLFTSVISILYNLFYIFLFSYDISNLFRSEFQVNTDRRFGCFTASEDPRIRSHVTYGGVMLVQRYHAEMWTTS